MNFIHLPMKMEPIVSSETSAIKSQTPGNYPKRNKLQYEPFSITWFETAGQSVNRSVQTRMEFFVCKSTYNLYVKYYFSPFMEKAGKVEDIA